MNLPLKFQNEKVLTILDVLEDIDFFTENAGKKLKMNCQMNIVVMKSAQNLILIVFDKMILVRGRNDK